MERPRCKRCGGPLDVWHDEETGKAVWTCENVWDGRRHVPMRTDEETCNLIDNLPGDDVASLERIA